MPGYAYTSPTLEALIPAMAGAFRDVRDFRLRLLALDRPQAKPSTSFAQKHKSRRRNALQRSAGGGKVTHGKAGRDQMRAPAVTFYRPRVAGARSVLQIGAA